MFEVNEKTIYVCKDAFSKFIGNGLYVGLFLISILYVISYMKNNDNKEKKIKIILGIYCIIVFILNLNPVFTKWITGILNEHDTYWRVYWLLPIGISIAFMFTEIIFRKDRKIDKVIMFVLTVCIIVLSGSYMYNSEDAERFVKVNNYYKVPDKILDIIEHVSKDNEKYKKLAGNEYFLVYTRQIDGNIILSEGRRTDGKYPGYSIVSLLGNSDLKTICDYCVNTKSNYLVVNKDVEFPNEYILGYDIKKMYKNDEYSLYKFNRISEE